MGLARLARRLGVTQRWLRDEADAGRVPHLRAGSRYLFSPTAVEEVLADRAAGKGDTGDTA
jgi:excisionase family DNA binding protein